MRTLREIIETLDEAYPFAEACSYDNVGLLVGRREKEIRKILLALDVTSAVIREAKEAGADMILSHHPVIFREIKRVTDESYTGSLVLSLIESGLAAVALHTDFDRGEEGNNDVLARTLGAGAYEKIDEGFATEFDLARETSFDDFADEVQEALADTIVRRIGVGPVRRVIAACGAGIDEKLIFRAKERGAVIVTADIKHNYATMARDLGVGIVETTHYASEWGFTDRMKEFLAERFDDVEVIVSRENINPYD